MDEQDYWDSVHAEQDDNDYWGEMDAEAVYAEEMEMLNRHVANCTKAERDEYCKICMEY
jgi:hypothetical protein